MCGVLQESGVTVEILRNTDPTGPDHPLLGTKTCLPSLVITARSCPAGHVSTHHQWVGDGGTDRKGERIPKLSFPSFLNPAPRELLRPFSFPGVSGQLPSPSMSVLIQFTMLEPLRRIFPQETGREAFPRPRAEVFLTFGAVRPYQHLSLPFLSAS